MQSGSSFFAYSFVLVPSCSGKLSDYESSGAINDVLEARQQQCRILEQKEEDLLELVRTLESDLHTTQKARVVLPCNLCKSSHATVNERMIRHCLTFAHS